MCFIAWNGMMKQAMQERCTGPTNHQTNRSMQAPTTNQLTRHKVRWEVGLKELLVLERVVQLAWRGRGGGGGGPAAGRGGGRGRVAGGWRRQAVDWEGGVHVNADVCVCGGGGEGAQVVASSQANGCRGTGHAARPVGPQARTPAAAVMQVAFTNSGNCMLCQSQLVTPWSAGPPYPGGPPQR